MNPYFEAGHSKGQHSGAENTRMCRSYINDLSIRHSFYLGNVLMFIYNDGGTVKGQALLRSETKLIFRKIPERKM